MKAGTGGQGVFFRFYLLSVRLLPGVEFLEFLGSPERERARAATGI